MKIITILYISLCMLGVISTGVCASTEKILGVYGSWAVYQNKIADKKVCYLAGTPKKSTGKYTKRGDCFLMISACPTDHITEEVSFVSGYSYHKKTPPALTIDKNKTVSLITEKGGETAWTANNNTDNTVIAQMKQGNLLHVQGVSLRGNKITDSFSLKGFSKAYEALKECTRNNK